MSIWNKEKMEKEAIKLGKGVVPVNLQEIAAYYGAIIRIEILDEEVSGMLITSSKSMKKIILVNQKNHQNRKRFTIAHEIAHLIMHKDIEEVFVDSRGSATMYFRSEESVNNLPLAERQANEFASCILMPKDTVLAYIKDKPIDLNDDVAVKIMANKFEVSIQALSIRLAKLNLTNQI